MINSRKRFLGCYFAFSILSGLLILRQYFTLILKNNGVSLQEINFILSVFVLIKVILEIPMGAVADYVGCKKIITFAFLIYILGFVVILFNKTIFGYQFFYIVYSIKSAIISSSIENYVYGNMDYFYLDKKMARYENISLSLYTFASFLSSFVGGILIFHNINFVIAMDIFTSITILLILIFTNDHSSSNIVRYKNNYFESIKSSFSFLFKHRTFLKLTVFQILYGSMQNIVEDYSLLFFSNMVVGGLNSAKLLSLKEISLVILEFLLVLHLAKRKITFLLVISILSGFFGIYGLYANSSLAFFSIISFLAIIEVVDLVISTRIYNFTPKKVMCTIVSIKYFLTNILRFFSICLIAILNTIFSYNRSFISLFILYIIFTTICFILLRNDPHFIKKCR